MNIVNRIRHNFIIVLIGLVMITAVPITHAAPAITDLAVWLNGNHAGENGAYYLSFTNSDTPLSATDEDTISVTFPAGTTLAKENLTTGDVKLNNVPIDARRLTVVRVANTIHITVPTDIGADAYTLIEFSPTAGIYHPTNIGNYQLGVTFTYNGATPPPPVNLQTNMYSIIGTAVTTPLLTVANTGTGKSSDYTIQFKGSVVENDTIYVAFPKEFGYTTTNTLVNSIKINDKTAKKAEVQRVLTGTFRESLLLAITVPNGISTFTNKETKVTMAAHKNLTNPSIEGNYAISVYTSRDVVPQKSNNIAIRHQSSNITAQLTPATIREAGEYRIAFKTNGALQGPNDYIEVLFPSDTNVPTSISNGHVMINSFIARSVERDKNNTRTLRVYLPDNRSITAGESVTLLFSARASIKNPSTNGNYTLQLRTIADQSYATSTSYTITGGSAVSPPPVTPPATPPILPPDQYSSAGLVLSSLSPNGVSRYEITYRTSVTGILKGGEDEITVLFQDAAQLPAFIDREYIRVNSAPVDTGLVRISTQSITFRMPSKINIAGNSGFNILIDEKAGIRHPQTTGYYTLYVYTSKDSLAGYSYQIQGQTASGFYIEPTYDTYQQLHTYTMTWKNNRNSMLMGGEDWAELTLPRAITQAETNKMTLLINGHAVDMSTVQITGQRIAFFIPKGIAIVHGMDMIILLHDPEHVVTNPNDRIVTFRMKTSKDTVDIESNPIAVYAPTTPVPSLPGTPSPGDTNTQPPSPGTNVPAGTTIKLYLNKADAYINNVRTKDLLAAPYIHPQKDGHTMVPIRFISEALGADVQYKPEGKKIIVTYFNQQIIFTIGSDIALKQAGGERLPVPVELRADGITFIPVRFISEWLGFTVDYNPTDKSILLTK